MPEILSMRHATLNVELENPVHFLKFDVAIPNVQWIQNYPPETFRFIRASLLPESDKFKNPLPCLLYFPSLSPHRLNPFMLEIITGPLNLVGVEKCSVHLSQSFRRADWLIFGD